MTARQPLRPAPPPVETDVVRAVAIGTVLWLLALAASLVALPALRDRDLGWLPWTCASGAALGVLGVWYCRRREAAIRRSAVLTSDDVPDGTSRPS